MHFSSQQNSKQIIDHIFFSAPLREIVFKQLEYSSFMSTQVLRAYLSLNINVNVTFACRWLFKVFGFYNKQ